MLSREQQIDATLQRLYERQLSQADAWAKREAAKGPRSKGGAQPIKLHRERTMARFKARVEAEGDAAHPIRRMRVERGWTAAELALRAGGIGRATVLGIETRLSPNPRRATLVSIARAFEVHPNELRDDADA